MQEICRKSSRVCRIWLLILVLACHPLTLLGGPGEEQSDHQNTTSTYKKSRAWKKPCVWALAALIPLAGYVAWGEGIFDPSPRARLQLVLSEGNIDPVNVNLDIVHMRQLHFHLGTELTPDVFNVVLEGQWNILGRISKGDSNKRLVFMEGLVDPLDGQMRESLRSRVVFDPSLTGESDGDLLSHFRLVTNAFPDKTLPEKLEDWNEEQKSVLVRVGAPYLLWAVGALETVYPSEDSTANSVAGKTIERTGYSPWLPHHRRAFRRKVHEDREIIALKKILEIVGNNNRSSVTEVILVYGGGHNFEKYSFSDVRVRSEESLSAETRSRTRIK